MKSSYNNKVDYSDILKSIVFMQKPDKIIEFGILDGLSLKTFADNSSKKCIIKAFDIFDEFNGNSANKDELNKCFLDYKNVSINYGDYYKEYKNIEDNSIDIIHIDIANNGDVIEFAFENYINKLTINGIFIFEGGSKERDEIDWMNKYNKKKINPIFEKYKKEFLITTIGNIPSLTIVKK
jgi:hypothetical protein